MRIIFLLFFVLALLFNLPQTYAQVVDSCHYHIEGTVYDLSTREPLPFATIQLKGTTKGTVADINGYFYLNTICQEEFDLIFSHIGYKPVVHHHDVHHKLPKIYLAPDDVTLQSVIIEGEVTSGDLSSGTVSSLSAKELELSQSSSFGEVVDQITGVSVIKSGQNVVKPVIHGLHSNRILIINNGVRHSYQGWGQEHAPEIDPSMAGNIEVIKGAATVRYGPDALGGVLVINPPKPELLDPLTGEVGITGATNGRSLDVSGRLQKGFHRFALIGEAAYAIQGDLKAPDYYLTNTSRREMSAAIGGRYHIQNIDITGYYSHFNQSLGILRGSVTGSLDELADAMVNEPPDYTGEFDYNIENPRQEVVHDMFKLDASLTKSASIFKIQYAYQSNHRQEYDVRRGPSNEIPSINLKLFTHILDVDWKHPEFRGWYGTIGVQSFYQDNNNIYGTNTIPFVPNYNNYRVGAFIIETKELPALTVEWGLRYDYQRSSVRSTQPYHRSEPEFRNFTATAGIRKQINENTFTSNIGSAWRPPSISELYAFGKHQNSIEYGLQRFYFDESGNLQTNEILGPDQKEIKSEKGIKWINTYTIRKSAWEAEISGYINYLRDYIYTKPAGITTISRGPFPYFLYNQTNAVFTGADLSILLMHSAYFNSIFKGSYLYAKDTRNNDYFTEIPPAEISYRLNYEQKKWLLFSSISAGAELSYTFEPFYHPRVIHVKEIIDAKAEGREIFKENSKAFDLMAPPSGYLLADLHITGRIKTWDLMVRVKNLFNTEYRTYTDRLRYFADDTGRNFIFSVKYNF